MYACVVEALLMMNQREVILSRSPWPQYLKPVLVPSAPHHLLNLSRCIAPIPKLSWRHLCPCRPVLHQPFDELSPWFFSGRLSHNHLMSAARGLLVRSWFAQAMWWALTVDFCAKWPSHSEVPSKSGILQNSGKTWCFLNRLTTVSTEDSTNESVCAMLTAPWGLPRRSLPQFWSNSWP